MGAGEEDLRPRAECADHRHLIAVPPNGNVIDFFTDILPNGTPRLALLRSFDKGETWEAKPTIITIMSFSFTGTITPDLQEPVRDGAILFDVAVDRVTGRLYIVWQDTRFRGIDQVAFSQSSDNGATWSRPIRIDRTPPNANILRQQAFVPSIEVGPDGELVVTYYNFQNDTAETPEATDYWSVFCSSDCTRRAGRGGRRSGSWWRHDDRAGANGRKWEGSRRGGSPTPPDGRASTSPPTRSRRQKRKGDGSRPA